MGKKIWTGLALGSVVTVVLFFILELFDFAWSVPEIELAVFLGCFVTFSIIGFVFDKIFNPILEFIHSFTQHM